jgi:hypothetical protein
MERSKANPPTFDPFPDPVLKFLVCTALRDEAAWLKAIPAAT